MSWVNQLPGSVMVKTMTQDGPIYSLSPSDEQVPSFVAELIIHQKLCHIEDIGLLPEQPQSWRIGTKEQIEPIITRFFINLLSQS
jgi:hypothetical protein